MKNILGMIICLIAVLGCNSTPPVKENATEIISRYYKNKYIDMSIILSENDRLVLDTVVLRLQEKDEPEAIIQFIVNDYKLKYGIK